MLYYGRMIRLHAHSLTVSPTRRSSLRGVKAEGGGKRGAELYDRKKAWPSIKHSILFVANPPVMCRTKILRALYQDTRLYDMPGGP
jgi:hypothetical protein